MSKKKVIFIELEGHLNIWPHEPASEGTVLKPLRPVKKSESYNSLENYFSCNHGEEQDLEKSIIDQIRALHAEIQKFQNFKM